jgi:hypothetical protein
MAAGSVMASTALGLHSREFATFRYLGHATAKNKVVIEEKMPF